MKNLLIILPVALTLAGHSASQANADSVINDNLIVTTDPSNTGGGVCIGANCVDFVNFGFTTLMLDQTDPSIVFQDTSNSGSFPGTDWRVGAETASGTFSIGNMTTGDTVFAISGDGNAIGIGAGATLTNGAVSVGGLRVSNVADAVEQTDAVTLGQFNAAMSTLPDDLLALNDANAVIAAANSEMLTSLSNEINAVGAIGSAMSALQVNPRGEGDHFVSFGMGYYEGSTALALGSFHYSADNRIFVNTGISAATDGVGGTAARIGVSFGR